MACADLLVVWGRNSMRSSEGRKTFWGIWACGKRELPTDTRGYHFLFSSEYRALTLDAVRVVFAAFERCQTTSDYRSHQTFSVYLCVNRRLFASSLLLVVTRCYYYYCYRYQIFFVTVMVFCCTSYIHNLSCCTAITDGVQHRSCLADHTAQL